MTPCMQSASGTLISAVIGKINGIVVAVGIAVYLADEYNKAERERRPDRNILSGSFM